MSTNSKKTATSKSADPLPVLWSGRTRFIVSLLVVFHITAVAIAPFHFATQNASPASGIVFGFAKPYVDAVYLNHGYFFFAPDPGSSHLVGYRVELDVEGEGRSFVEGRFPDRNQQWPRLLYHRHFMLSESLNSNFLPSVAPPSVAGDPVALENWRNNRSIYEALQKSFKNRLMKQHGGKSVELQRIEHRPPEWGERFELNYELTDDRLYRILSEDPGDVSESLPNEPVELEQGPVLPGEFGAGQGVLRPQANRPETVQPEETLPAETLPAETLPAETVPEETVQPEVIEPEVIP